MAIGDIPSIASSTYTTQAYIPDHAMTIAPFLGAAGDIAPLAGGVNFRRIMESDFAQKVAAQDAYNRLQERGENVVADKPTRRIVQVYIADTDENVPLENSLLYKGEPKLTDATDQELFFEIDIKGILDSHNEKRKTFINKKVKDRTEYLEPARVRDLKMVVVNIAQF
jgi:hypothetical protein